MSLLSPKSMADDFAVVEKCLLGNGDGSGWLGTEAGEIEFRSIHGDLNSGNVLVRADGSTLLIDFASFGRAPLLLDACKLERDIVLRCLDGKIPIEADVSSLERWRPLLQLYEMGQLPQVGSGSVDAVADDFTKEVAVVEEIRQQVSRRASRLESKQYLCGLLGVFVRAICNIDLAFPKRLFAVQVAATLIRQAAGARAPETTPE